MRGTGIATRAGLRAALVAIVLLVPGRPAKADGLAVSLGLPQGSYRLIEDVSLRVQVTNHSNVARVIGLGPAVWKDHIQLRRGGHPVTIRATEGVSDELYELVPGASVGFALPLVDYVIPFVVNRAELAAQGYAGEYSVTVRVVEASSDAVTFTVDGALPPGEPGRRASHGALGFLAQQQSAYERARAGGDMPAMRRVAREIELFVLEHRHPHYADPLEETAVARLTVLLRRCVGLDGSLRLTGSYLAAREAMGPGSPALVKAARLEHEALDLVAAGRVDEALGLFNRVFGLVPEEVAYHVSAVRALSPLGAAWNARRRDIALQGSARLRAVEPHRRNPGMGFAARLLESQAEEASR